MRLLSYNMNGKYDAWQSAAETGADIAMLQEVSPPQEGIDAEFMEGAAPWKGQPGAGEVWKCAVANVSDRYRVTWLAPHIAEVELPDEVPLLVVSLYARWQKPHESLKQTWIFADASAHERINERSAFIGSRNGHRIIAAGDLNILYGYGEHGDNYWRDRYLTVFDRFKTLGLRFCGPQYPNGRQADPWPSELPKDSLNVPTYHTNRTGPSGAKRQLDLVFASESIADRVSVRALNGVDEWGKSDHCRVVIEHD